MWFSTQFTLIYVLVLSILRKKSSFTYSQSSQSQRNYRSRGCELTNGMMVIPLVFTECVTLKGQDSYSGQIRHTSRTI